MSILLRVITAVIGLLLLCLGVGAAAYVGSDDTVYNGSDTVADDGRPVVTVPTLFTYDHLDVTVRASAPDGVFIGTAHPVDIADYTADTARFELTGVTRGGVQGASIDGDKPAIAPADAPFWADRASGTGNRSLTAAAGAAAPRFVVAPLGSGPVTMSFGATIDGLFTTALVIAGVGLLLLLATAFWTVRRRRARSRAAAPAPPPPNSNPVSSASRLALPVALGALGLALSGCVSIPAEVAASSTGKTALVDTELEGLFASYDERNNKAIKAANPPAYDIGKWQQADAGIVLDADSFGTQLDRVTKDKKKSNPLFHEGLRVYSGQFDSYPMWALVAHRGKDQKPKKGSDADLVSVSVFTRERAAEPWLMSTSTSVHEADLPAPGEPAPMPAGKTLDPARKAVKEQVAFLCRGGKSSLADKGAKAFRAQFKQYSKIDFIGRSVVVSEPYADKPLHAVRVAGGILVVATHELTTRIYAKPGKTISWGEPLDQLRESYGRYLAESYGASSVLFVPGDGDATSLGTSYRAVR